MDVRAALRHVAVADRYRSIPIERERLERVLDAAANTPGFARQYPVRFLLVYDDPTKRALRQACEAQRQRWFRDTAPWMHAAMEEAGEHSHLTSVTDAPCIVCVFGEIEKAGWREAAWCATERLRLAALAEGLHAEAIHVDSLGFLNALFDVPQAFSGIAMLALGEPESVRTLPPSDFSIHTRLIPYQPDAEHLLWWNDPLRAQEMQRKQSAQPRPFLSHKGLLLNAIQTSGEIASASSLDRVFDLATTQMQRFFRYDQASIGFLDPEDGRVRLRNIFKENRRVAGEEYLIPLSETNIIGWVILNNAGILRHDIAWDEMFTKQVAHEDLQSDMVVPLVSDGTVLGTLNVGSQTANCFTQADFDILRELGKIVGVAVERIRSADRQLGLDVLTGVLGHRKFPLHLAVEVARCREREASCGLLIVNIDSFRALNERFGMDAGDQVLIGVADMIRTCTRDVDVLARISGREFGVILPETDLDGLALVSERIRSTVEMRSHVTRPAHAKQDMEFWVTVSIGAALVVGDDAESAHLLDQATAALRRAKREGKNGVCIFDPQIDGAAPRSRSINANQA